MIPIAETLYGASLACENANRLFIASAHLKREGFVGAAAALCVLAFEEAAKAISLVYRSQGLASTDWIKAYFTDHKVKHELGANVASFSTSLLSKIGFEITLNDTIVNSVEMSNRIEIWRQQADSIKKQGFYIDYQCGKWVTPDQITEELFESGIIACGIAIASATGFIKSAK